MERCRPFTIVVATLAFLLTQQVPPSEAGRWQRLCKGECSVKLAAECSLLGGRARKRCRQPIVQDCTQVARTAWYDSWDADLVLAAVRENCTADDLGELDPDDPGDGRTDVRGLWYFEGQDDEGNTYATYITVAVQSGSYLEGSTDDWDSWTGELYEDGTWGVESSREPSANCTEGLNFYVDPSDGTGWLTWQLFCFNSVTSVHRVERYRGRVSRL